MTKEHKREVCSRVVKILLTKLSDFEFSCISLPFEVLTTIVRLITQTFVDGRIVHDLILNIPRLKSG